MKTVENDELLSSVYKLLANVSTPELKELLQKKCEELGISQRKLSDVIGLERKSIQRIMEDEAQKIDIVTFIKISQFLKIDVSELVQIYVSKLSDKSIKEIESTRKASFILHYFDLDTLKKTGFIKNRNNFEEIENRLKSFFGLSSLFEYAKYSQAAYFSRTQRNYSDKMLNFWISLVYHEIKNVENPNEYDKSLLLNVLPKLRGLTRDETNGLQRIVKALFEVGVTVIIQTYFSKTEIRGASFVYNNKPFIVLTNYNKRYDSIWFSLAHELYHVLKDYKQIEKLNYHITGQSDLFIDELAEENADEFARELLFPKEKREYIKNFIDIPTMVEDYARQNNVHPAIIYGFYLYEKSSDTEYKKYRRLLNNSDVAVKSMLINPWVKNDVDEITKEIAKIFTN